MFHSNELVDRFEAACVLSKLTVLLFFFWKYEALFCLVCNCVYLDVISEDDDSAGELWVACDLCDAWYHVMCTSIPPEDHNRLADVHWACENC